MLSPGPMPSLEVMKPASFALIVWALRSIPLVNSGSRKGTRDNIFWPTRTSSPNFILENVSSVSKTPNPLILRTPGMSSIMWIFPSPSMKADHSDWFMFRALTRRPKLYRCIVIIHCSNVPSYKYEFPHRKWRVSYTVSVVV